MHSFIHLFSELIYSTPPG